MGWFRKINKNGEDYKPIGNVITATSLSVAGPDLADGDVVRVMFTTDIAGSDTSTPLALTWNSGATPIPVKASKEGSLASIYAFEYATNLYRYISAYVTLELAYDGTNQQFVVVGNPVILSGSNYTIYADGYKLNKKENKLSGYEVVTFTNNYKTIEYDGVLNFLAKATNAADHIDVFVNDVLIAGSTGYRIGGETHISCTVFVNKGDIVHYITNSASTLIDVYGRFYKFRDYQ